MTVPAASTFAPRKISPAGVPPHVRFTTADLRVIFPSRDDNRRNDGIPTKFECRIKRALVAEDRAAITIKPCNISTINIIDGSTVRLKTRHRGKPYGTAVSLLGAIMFRMTLAERRDKSNAIGIIERTVFSRPGRRQLSTTRRRSALRRCVRYGVVHALLKLKNDNRQTSRDTSWSEWKLTRFETIFVSIFLGRSYVVCDKLQSVDVYIKCDYI